MASFESVVDEYDAARPSYPSGVFDALGPLEGLVVLDVGAGTGIATRQLLGRRARVIAVDPGHAVLSRAISRTPQLPAVVADGAVAPMRTGCVDLVCFAQSWHWLTPSTRVAEVHRVLRPGGRWAGWWSHARADQEDWFETHWSVIERSCPGTHRGQRDLDWGASLSGPGLFDVGERIVVPWTRVVSTDRWILEQASYSYVAALTDARRTQLLAELRQIVDQQFPDGAMTLPYETWLWIATRSGAVL